MSGRFPRVSRLSHGYAARQVDAYLNRVEAALDAGVPSGHASAAAIRRAAFDLVLHGYAPMAVDEALDRLEERALELERAATESGALPVAHDVWAEAASLGGRLERPRGERFRMAGRLVRGYRPADVDALLDALAGPLGGGPGVGADEVRRTTFGARRGGYDEDEVDDYLDRVVDVLLRRRTESALG